MCSVVMKFCHSLCSLINNKTKYIIKYKHITHSAFDMLDAEKKSCVLLLLLFLLLNCAN